MTTRREFLIDLAALGLSMGTGVGVGFLGARRYITPDDGINQATLDAAVKQQADADAEAISATNQQLADLQAQFDASQTELQQLQAAAQVETAAQAQPTETTYAFAWLTPSDRRNLAQIANLGENPNWQQILTNPEAGYGGSTEFAGWTGFGFMGETNPTGPTTGYGLFVELGNGNNNYVMREMPRLADGSVWTPENSPVTRRAWEGVTFPPGYFNGVQPLNAPNTLPDGHKTVDTRVYQPDSNRNPYDLKAWGSTFAFIQGSNIIIGNTFNSSGPAYALAVPLTTQHLWITEGEVDIINTPNDLSPEAQTLLAMTWFNGYRASQGVNQRDQHGNWVPANVYQVENGTIRQDPKVTVMWKP